MSILNHRKLMSIGLMVALSLLAGVAVIYGVSLIKNTLSTTPTFASSQNLLEPDWKEVMALVDRLYQAQAKAQSQNVQPKDIPIYGSSEEAFEGYVLKTHSYTYENGDTYKMMAIDFENAIGDLPTFNEDIHINGTQIQIRWQGVNAQNGEKMWVTTDQLTDLPTGTLFIDTDLESLIVNSPSVYLKQQNFNTKENVPHLEKALTITRDESGYTVSAQIPADAVCTGEFWYVHANKALIEWNEYNSTLWLRQDLFQNRRWSWDGYYFRSPSTYDPYSEQAFYKNPANFTGAQLLTASGSRGADILGYVMTKECLKNQNNYGFFETGPRSQWLWGDFDIGYYFYDTRFNTDYAESLLRAYQKYGEKDFLEGVLKYSEFFYHFAVQNGYATDGPYEGLLVPDYWWDQTHKKTHVSLNHQLAEINFLLRLHTETKESKFLNLALKMLGGINDTTEDWIQADHNLVYALHYNEGTHQLVDYPYLTYNDLYDTRALLMEYGLDSTHIQRLMDEKKAWMDANGVTGYKK